MPPQITSRQHPLVKHIRSLHAAKGRRESGQFVIEGRNGVQAALEANWPLVEILYDEESDPLVQRALQGNVSLRPMATDVLAYTSEAQTSPGILALANLPVAADKISTTGLTLIIDGIGDPGNMGTLLRAADAAGASQVLVTAGSTDPWSPKVVRSAAGSLFHLPPLALSDRSPATIAQLFADAGVPLVTAEAHGGTNSFSFAWPTPCALILGHETRGISPEFQRVASHAVTIPVYGRAESLNVAMAGSLLLYSWRQAHP